MARITPKTNWVAHNIPVATDFNRIEGNNQQAFDEIDDLGSALDAEEVARIAATQPASLLDSIKTVDGAGSGLDADLLDGMSPFSTFSPNTIVSRGSDGKTYISPIIPAGDLSGSATRGEIRLVNTGYPTYVDRLYIYVNDGLGTYRWRAMDFLS